MPFVNIFSLHYNVSIITQYIHFITFLYATLQEKEAIIIKAAGVIVEYNPFHNGHAYHLQETKKLTEGDVYVAVMSGSFLQRGEPALVSKWARTKMALEGGLDLVVELPYCFSTQKAETFASGAVSILDALGVHELCFGSESGHIHLFQQTLEQQRAHDDRFHEAVRERMKEGLSYPRALSSAFADIENGAETVSMSKPNNILGFHYMQAITKQRSTMKAHTIQRLSAQYHDETFAAETIASATSIRKHIETNGVDAVEAVVPSSTLAQLMKYRDIYGLFHHWERYFPLLKYRLLTMTAAQLRHIYEAEEGLEYRVLSYIREATSFQSFMQSLKTKRYTWTRLQRLCLHILTHTTKEEMELARHELPPYIRVLGMSKKGQAYISARKKSLPVPLITNMKAFQHPLLELDTKANAVYYSILPEPIRSKMLKAEFIQHPLRYDEDEKHYL